MKEILPLLRLALLYLFRPFAFLEWCLENCILLYLIFFSHGYIKIINETKLVPTSIKSIAWCFWWDAALTLSWLVSLSIRNMFLFVVFLGKFWFRFINILGLDKFCDRRESFVKNIWILKSQIPLVRLTKAKYFIQFFWTIFKKLKPFVRGQSSMLWFFSRSTVAALYLILITLFASIIYHISEKKSCFSYSNSWSV